MDLLDIAIDVNIDIDIENIDIDDINDDNDHRIAANRVNQRYIRDGQNPYDLYDAEEFKRRFRFSKDSVMFGILPKIYDRLAKYDNRGSPISPELQLAVCLRYYAIASFQAVVGPWMEVLHIVPELGSAHDSCTFRKSASPFNFIIILICKRISHVTNISFNNTIVRYIISIINVANIIILISMYRYQVYQLPR